MQAIMEFFILVALLSIIKNPHFVVANLQHPDNGLRGNESDYKALLAIKSKITSDPHSALSSWNNSLHFCQWEGVTCGHRHHRVVGLKLNHTDLAGTLSPFIGNISFLRNLWLFGNSFHGAIPTQIFHLTRLQKLALSQNYFEGGIPTNLSSCLHLTKLGLASNYLVGKIPIQLATLPNLEVLDLSQNNFIGRLVDIGFGNTSTSMQKIHLGTNHLEGSIPNGIGRLKNLVFLVLSDNILSGTIPSFLFNLSNLESLYLSRNKLHGHLPQDVGIRLPHLSYLYIAYCSLIGQVPTSLSNMSKLVGLDISYNSFKGNFSINGNLLPQFSYLDIDSSFPPGQEERDLSFLDTLTNCTNLKSLELGSNTFTGNFPHSILNISTGLEWFNIDVNHLSGQIPFGLGKFVKLKYLNLGYNHLTGPIPLDIGNLESLQGIDFSDNNLLGEIPSSLGNLTILSELYMENNKLVGSLPVSLGNCKNLLHIDLSCNNLSGRVPVELFRASSLISLELGQNKFEGSFPVEISSLKNLIWLDVSHNRFSGELPTTLGGCTGLTFLNVSQNTFVGSIPKSLSPLKSIQYLDLSCNSFSGQIPNFFSTWPNLFNLNLSFNNLTGEVPTNGIFSNTSATSIVGNDKLCGGVSLLNLPRCPKSSKRRRLSFTLIMIISIACALMVVLSVALSFHLYYSSRKRKGPSSEQQSTMSFLELSYRTLHMATNGFSLSNLLGVGGFGSVYKGILRQDGLELVVAVKVINLQNKSASKSFIAECNALRNIRHRNLVKIITTCSSLDAQRNDFKALVYEFMSRASLEDWLHSSNLVHLTSEHVDGSLSLFQRLSIVIDVASALEYLHTECANPIIHCDLKPSNILFDEEMTAHVSDFGLAKFLSGPLSSTSKNQTSSSQVRGTIGYMAPEYGLGSKVSPEGDIYSFGIVVLELMTSKKPTEPMFKDNLNLHDFAKAALPSRVMEIVDQKMLGNVDLVCRRTGADAKKIECIESLIMIGVECSRELPQERMSIKSVLNELKSTRKNLLALGVRN